MGLKSKITIDVLMMIGMFGSMSFHMFSLGPHKMLGMLTFVLFLIHNISNRGWYRSLFRGRYELMRVLNTAINGMMLLAMIGIMVSGVLLSKELAASVAVQGMTMPRMLHLVCSYVECVAMALHIGVHLKGRIIYAR